MAFGNSLLGGDTLTVVDTGGVQLFGDGSDGDLTLTTDTSLTRDASYRDVDTNGFDLCTAGYVLRVSGTLTVRAGDRVHNDGGAAPGTGIGGIGAPGNIGGISPTVEGTRLLGGTSGGGVGAPGVDTTAIAPDIVGGLGGSISGGTIGGRFVFVAGVIPIYPTSIFDLTTLVTREFAGGTGGAGGANGGGGGGAGVCAVFAREIICDGAISADGGTGSAGAGPGCGGGGGILLLVYASLTGSGTTTANGGAPGAGGGGSNPGGPGRIGKVVIPSG